MRSYAWEPSDWPPTVIKKTAHKLTFCEIAVVVSNPLDSGTFLVSGPALELLVV